MVNLMRNQAGFSLTQMLVFVLIIGFLGLLGTPWIMDNFFAFLARY
jgi:competence protein ComGC